MKRFLLLLLLLPFSCVLPSDRGRSAGPGAEALVRLQLERVERDRAAQEREAARLRAELEQVREKLAGRERAERERKFAEERAEWERRLEEERAREKARTQAQLDARFAELLGTLEKKVGEIQAVLRQELHRELRSELRAGLPSKLRKEVDGRIRTALGEFLKKWGEERKNLLAAFSRERDAEGERWEARQAKLQKILQAQIDRNVRELRSKALAPPRLDPKELVAEILEKLHPLVKEEVGKELEASVRPSLEDALRTSLEKNREALEPLKDHLLRVEALGKKRARDLDLKVTALGRAVDSLVEAVRGLRAQAARESAARAEKGGQAARARGARGKPGAKKGPASAKNSGEGSRRPPKGDKPAETSSAPIRRRKAGVPSFGAGDGFFERPEYWLPSLVLLLLVFVLLGGRTPAVLPHSADTPEAGHLAPKGRSHGKILQPLPPPQAPVPPSPLHLSFRIPPGELAPQGEEAVRAFLSSEAMVLVRPEPRVDRRRDGSLSVRFYLPGDLPRHLRRELRERCENLARGGVSSPTP